MGENEGPLVDVQMLSGFGVITLDDGGRLNCLSRSLVAAVLDGLTDLLAGGARAVVLRARPGVKVWSAGHYLKEVPTDGSDPITWNVPFEKLLRRVRECPVPVLGMIEGGVWGGACDLAMAMDILVGCPGASFAITPAKLGLPYNTSGLAHFLGVVPLHVLKEMLFTGRPLSAEDAYRLGVLNRLVPAADLEQATFGLAAEIASRAPLAVRVLKEELRRLTVGAGLSADEFEQIQSLRDTAFHSEDFREGLRAFFEKRPPNFTGE